MEAEFIVVHNTYNNATAQEEIRYMISNSMNDSFHYAVDDKEIVNGIPESRNTWNAGDGGNGKGNRKGISIEICYSLSGGERFVAAEKLASKFVAFKLHSKGWGIDKVKKHQDFSEKYCPHRTLDLGWDRFLKMVQLDLNSYQDINKPSNWAIDDWNWAKEEGYLDGTRPKDTVLREELAAVIHRILKGVK